MSHTSFSHTGQLLCFALSVFYTIMPGEAPTTTPTPAAAPASKAVVHHRAAPLTWAEQMFRDPFQAWDMMPYWTRGFGQQAMRDFGLDRQLSEITNNDDKFAVKLDVSQYKPEELEVTTKDNTVTITGRHEERQDEHGYVARSFTRRYVLPEGTSIETLTSTLNKDGFLSLEAPKTGHRRIPIMQK